MYKIHIITLIFLILILCAYADETQVSQQDSDEWDPRMCRSLLYRELLFGNPTASALGFLLALAIALT